MPAILEIIYFFLPAIGANMTPVFVSHYNFIPILNKPIDLNAKWKSKRLLGDNKTIRGLVTGVTVAILIGLLQGTPLLGAALGLGTLLGDASASFVKRQLDIPPGQSWYPWDQIDFALGAIIISFWLAPLTFRQYLIATLLLGAGSYLASLLGIRLGLKKSL